jgi:hypothetical protein
MADWLADRCCSAFSAAASSERSIVCFASAILSRCRDVWPLDDRPFLIDRRLSLSTPLPLILIKLGARSARLGARTSASGSSFCTHAKFH